MLAGAPKYVRDELQRVLNSAARLLSNTKKFDSDLSRLLHTGLTFRSECSLSFARQFVDVCRTKLLSILHTDSRQRLRSASRHLLSVPHHRRTFGRRAFAVAGLTAWNSLPDDLRNLSCCDSYFGHFLQSILFSFY